MEVHYVSIWYGHKPFRTSKAYFIRRSEILLSIWWRYLLGKFHRSQWRHKRRPSEHNRVYHVIDCIIAYLHPHANVSRKFLCALWFSCAQRSVKPSFNRYRSDRTLISLALCLFLLVNLSWFRLLVISFTSDTYLSSLSFLHLVAAPDVYFLCLTLLIAFPTASLLPSG